MGDTPLHVAAAAGSLNDRGRQEVLDMLLGLGASADLPNKASFYTCQSPTFYLIDHRTSVATGHLVCHQSQQRLHKPRVLACRGIR